MTVASRRNNMGSIYLKRRHAEMAAGRDGRARTQTVGIGTHARTPPYPSNHPRDVSLIQRLPAWPVALDLPRLVDDLDARPAAASEELPTMVRECLIDADPEETRGRGPGRNRLDEFAC